LPGRTQQEAFDAFAEPLKQALSCVAHAKLTRSKLSITLEQEVVLQPLPLQIPNSDYQLFMSHAFRYLKTGIGEWRVTSLRYQYAVEVVKTKQEVAAFHWEGHENGSAPFAHLHLGYANAKNLPHLGPKAHIPTGRVAFEDVIYFLISELGVHPLKEDWRNVLATVRKPFMDYKTW
jgi:hypothetical protein